MALLGAALLEHGAARHDDVAAAAVHLEDLERLRDVHERGDVAHRADVDLAAGQEGHRAVEVDREAALDLVEDHALDLLLRLERLLELDPAFFPAGLISGNNRLAERVLDSLEIDLDRVADDDVALAARALELLQRDAPLGLQTDIDDGDIFFDGDDEPLDDGPFESLVVAVALLEQRGEIVTRGRVRGNV